MSSQQNRNQRIKNNYEMQNINQRRRYEPEDTNRPNLNVVYDDQSPNRYRNNYADDKPIFNLQNPNYSNQSSNRDDHYRSPKAHKSNYGRQDSTSHDTPHMQRTRFGGDKHSPDRRNLNYRNQNVEHEISTVDPNYGYDYSQNSKYNNPSDNQDYHLLNRQNQDEYSDVFSRWNSTDESELVNRQHRTISIHRNTTVRDATETVSRTFPRTLESRRKWMCPPGHTMKRTSLEQRANNIANRMEQDDALMENTPESEVLRREALRDMPQCLTVKRIIKKKLTTSVTKHSKRKPLNLFTRMKYCLEMKTSKIRNSFKSLAYSFELWYSSLKTIEGHFGSGVATYFKFLRWLFIMNCLIAFFTVMFLVLPQLLYTHLSRDNSKNVSANVIYEGLSRDGNFTSVIIPQSLMWSSLKLKADSFKNNATFGVQDIFTGQGYFTNTTLYYGFYTKDVVNLISDHKYSMPYAYFFTMFCMYVISFIILSTSMARSYRRSFIETQGGLKNVYAHKIFCGWDYSIATEDAGDLKSSSIYHEIKELVSDAINDAEKASCMDRFWTLVIQFVCNIVILCQLIGTGYIMWMLLENNTSDNSHNEESSKIAVTAAAIINVIMLLFPSIFSFIVRYEDYKHPRAALYITLIRTFLLKVVVIGVFVAFWLTHSDNEVNT